jgi:hypothetical protein
MVKAPWMKEIKDWDDPDINKRLKALRK